MKSWPYNVGLEDAPGYKGPEDDPTPDELHQEEVLEVIDSILDHCAHLITDFMVLDTVLNDAHSKGSYHSLKGLSCRDAVEAIIKIHGYLREDWSHD